MEIVLVHLTDLHISGEDDLDILIPRTAQIGGSICNHITTPEETLVLFCVTGDFASSGEEEQFTTAALVLDDIVEVVIRRYPEVKYQLIFVPGNHDCNFADSTNSIRNVLLSSPKLDISDNSQMQQCTGVQKNYFSFSKEMHALTCDDDKMITVKRFDLENSGISLVFHCINTSWCSEKAEKKGKMKFFCGNIPDRGKDDIVITLMHHGAEWFDWEDKKRWDDYHRIYSDIILVGHDHSAEFAINKNYDDTTRYYIKGNQLYDSNNKEQSGFNILKIDTDRMEECFFTYDWQGELYKKVIDTGYKMFERNQYAYTGIRLNKKFQLYLDSMDIDIKSKNSKELKLSNVYSFPTLREENGKSPRHIRSFEEAKLYIEENKFIVLQGNREFGKTALLKRLFTIYFELGKYPVFVDVSKIHSADGEYLNRCVEDLYMQIYENIQPEEIAIKEPEELMCLVDDLDGLSIGDKSAKKFLQYLVTRFGTVIVTRNNELNIIRPINYVEVNDFLDERFSTLNIRPVGGSAKERLVDKWLMLDKENIDIGEISFEEKRREKYSQIQTVMQNNFFNKTPMDLLLVLSYLDQEKVAPINYSKYSYIYEALILEKLGKIAKGDTNSISVYKTILQKLAYQIYTSKECGDIAEECILDIIIKYKKSYSNVRLSATDVLSRLVEYRFLENREDKYRFKHRYVYYYFVSNYINNKLDPLEAQNIIRDIFNNLSSDANYNVALFLLYFMNKQYGIMPIVRELHSRLLTDYSSFEYGELLGKINEWGGDIEEKVKRIYTVPENRNIPVLRKRQLNTYDEYDAEEVNSDKAKHANEDLEKRNEEVIQTVRLIEILGNLLKNYSGELDNDCREEIIDIMVTSMIKTIGAFCQYSVIAVNKIINMVLEKIESGDEKEIKAQHEFSEFIKKLFAEIWFSYVCLSIRALARSMECDIIMENVSTYCSKNASDFQRMLYLEYLMRIEQKLPISVIDNLFKGKNKLAVISQGIMKNNIRYYLINYQYDYKDKQRACDILDFNIKDVFIEEKKNIAMQKK